MLSGGSVPLPALHTDHIAVSSVLFEVYCTQCAELITLCRVAMQNEVQFMMYGIVQSSVKCKLSSSSICTMQLANGRALFFACRWMYALAQIPSSSEFFGLCNCFLLLLILFYLSLYLYLCNL